jgi:hypothetical protein
LSMVRMIRITRRFDLSSFVHINVLELLLLLPISGDAAIYRIMEKWA